MRIKRAARIPDFVDPAIWPSHWRRVALMASALALGAGVLAYVDGEERRLAAQMELDSANLLAKRGKPVQVLPSAKERSERAQLEQVRIEHVRLDRWLAVDWPARLRTVERAVASEASLLRLRVDGAGGSVELRGLIASVERFESLRSKLKASGVRSVDLLRHEPAVEPSAGKLLFVAKLEWP